MWSKVALWALIANTILFRECSTNNASQSLCACANTVDRGDYCYLIYARVPLQRGWRVCTWDCTRYDAYHVNSLSQSLWRTQISPPCKTEQHNIGGGIADDHEQRSPTNSRTHANETLSAPSALIRVRTHYPAKWAFLHLSGADFVVFVVSVRVSVCCDGIYGKSLLTLLH